MSIETIHRKNGTRFRAAVLIGSRRVSKTFRRKTDAKSWEAKTRVSRDLAPLAVLKANSIMTFGQLWERFVTDYSEIRNAPSTRIMNQSLYRKFLRARFENARLRDLTEEVWEKYFQLLRADKEVSPGRTNRVRQLLHTMFARAVFWRLVAQNPIERIEKLPNGDRENPPRYLSKVDTHRLLEWLRINDPWLFPKVLVLIYTGIRVGEMGALRVEDLKFESEKSFLAIGGSRCRHSGVFKTTKGKRSRIVPLGPGLSGFLSDLAKGRPLDAPLLWENWDEGRWPTKAYQRFKRALKATGTQKMTMHQLRHSYSFLFLEGNGHAYDLKEVLGHRDMRTCMVYTHFSPAMAERVRGVVDYHPPVPAFTVIEGGGH